MKTKCLLVIVTALTTLVVGCSKRQPNLEPVHFESATTNIVVSDYAILEDNLVGLEEYPDIKVELAGHTNTVGSDSENLVLSKARADTVKNWIVSNGIAPSRLTVKGYGETEPVAENTTKEGRALNDRVEFRIR